MGFAIRKVMATKKKKKKTYVRNVAVKKFPLPMTRVARWYIFKPKVQNREFFVGPLNWKAWLFSGHLEYLTVVRYTL
jgi:hypothetical protein